MTEYLIARLAKMKIKVNELKKLCEDMPEEGQKPIDDKAGRIKDYIENLDNYICDIVLDLM